MRLYLVRHAIAVPHGTPGIAEDDRPLTDEGIKKMQKASRGLKGLDIVPELILTSPLPRAKQTAEIVRDSLGAKIPLKLLPALAPSGKRQDVYREISEQKSVDALMLVGHEPSLGEMAGEIAWGSPDCYIELKKGGVCAIDVDRYLPTPHGTLVWLLTPGILRQLAS